MTDLAVAVREFLRGMEDEFAKRGVATQSTKAATWPPPKSVMIYVRVSDDSRWMHKTERFGRAVAKRLIPHRFNLFFSPELPSFPSDSCRADSPRASVRAVRDYNVVRNRSEVLFHVFAGRTP